MGTFTAWEIALETLGEHLFFSLIPPFLPFSLDLFEIETIKKMAIVNG